MGISVRTYQHPSATHPATAAITRRPEHRRSALHPSADGRKPTHEFCDMLSPKVGRCHHEMAG